MSLNHHSSSTFEPLPSSTPSSGAPRFALFLCCLGVLLLGIVPGLLMRLAEVAGNLIRF
jgi:hypothetical protein